MFETKAEIDALQALLDRSFAAAGPHLADIVTAERRLSALQVAAYLQGVKHVSFATVTSRCEPMVAPLDGWFVHGQFIVSTGGSAVRVQHIRRNPAVSLAHVVGDDIGEGPTHVDSNHEWLRLRHLSPVGRNAPSLYTLSSGRR